MFTRFLRWFELRGIMFWLLWRTLLGFTIPSSEIQEHYIYIHLLFSSHIFPSILISLHSLHHLILFIYFFIQWHESLVESKLLWWYELPYAQIEAQVSFLTSRVPLTPSWPRIRYTLNFSFIFEKSLKWVKFHLCPLVSRSQVLRSVWSKVFLKLYKNISFLFSGPEVLSG